MGVLPQGGHLSPLLFPIFISYIDKCFCSCKFILFAYDIWKLIMPIFSNYDVISTTQFR